MTKVDFHVHSTCSDGLLAPENVVKRAYEKSVKYLALTDHDTVSGLDIAKAKAKSLGINFIPGIELSTNYNKESIHILGFFKDESYKDQKFIDYLNELKERRNIRAIKMIQKLKEEFNIIIDKDRIFKKANGGVIARPHIAYEIIESGYNYTKDEIFNKFIGKDCPAYVPTTKISPEEGINILRKHNALVFLAHPILIKKSPLTDFLSFGFDGIEGVYFQNSKEDEKRFINFALENNLLISAGSDCHGDFNGDTRHGDIGCMDLEEKYLKAFCNKYYSL
ncbi:MAG: PHP domain-containing protein [Clostridium sp.]|nr:PHP domain-containing protein [Clostridium sp.]